MILTVIIFGHSVDILGPITKYVPSALPRIYRYVIPLVENIKKKSWPKAINEHGLIVKVRCRGLSVHNKLY